MKKLIILASAAVIALGSMSSCKKDYTCTCSFESDSVDDVAYTYEKVSKSDATEACDLSGAVEGVTCELD